MRKAKASKKIALNKQIKQIDITIPEQYYKVIEVSKNDILGILKSDDVKVSKGTEYSVSIITD